MKTVGLFGTCGNSIWRNQFVEAYREKEISFFNPNITVATHGREWSPEDVQREAFHLAKDEIIVIPATAETFGTATLAEICICAAYALLEPRREFIVLVAPDVLEEVKAANPQAGKESNNARKIIRSHLKGISLKNLHFVQTLEEALELTVKLVK